MNPVRERRTHGPRPPVPRGARVFNYVRPTAPGIRRRRTGRGFAYFDPSGKRIRGAAVRRLRALAMVALIRRVERKPSRRPSRWPETPSTQGSEFTSVAQGLALKALEHH